MIKQKYRRRYKDGSCGDRLARKLRKDLKMDPVTTAGYVIQKRSKSAVIRATAHASREASAAGFAGLDHAHASEPVARVLPDDFILLAKFAKREFAFRRDDDEISPRVHGNRSIMAGRDRREILDLAVVRLLAPCFREARIALESEAVAVAIDRYNDFRSIRLPFRTKPRIDKPAAQKGTASVWTTRIYAAPLATQAVRAPRAPRLSISVTPMILQHKVQPPHDLSGSGSVGAGTLSRFCIGSGRSWFGQGSMAASHLRPLGPAVNSKPCAHSYTARGSSNMKRISRSQRWCWA